MTGHTLGKLTKGVQYDPICVRIMRKWSYCGTYGDRSPIFIGLVIVDKQVHLPNITL